MPRLIAIGDIHGCYAALSALLKAIDPKRSDTIIPLGDYVDRGPDSRKVIDRLLTIREKCNLVPLLGNHDQLMLLVCDGRRELVADWRMAGGDATLESYGGRSLAPPPLGSLPPEGAPLGITPAHLDFLRSCRLLYETEHHFFVHSSYEANKPLTDQDPFVLLWESLKRRHPGPHCSGKTAIVGHSKQKDGNILDLGYLKCIDTYCSGTGWLTAMEVTSGKVWQADKTGKLR